MTRLLLSTLIFLASSGDSFAGFSVLRDSIGPDSSLTDGLGGGIVDGESWYIWGIAGFLVEPSQSGVLTEFQTVVFARSVLEGRPPVNNIEDILGFNLRFHFWSDGAEAGPDSFSENAYWRDAHMQPGHIDVNVNSPLESFISVEEFGTTGPPDDPTSFKTFLLSADLSSFGIRVEADQQYVVGITHGLTFAGDGLYLRVIGSRATGFEDMYQECGRTSADDYCAIVTNLPDLRPGYLATQHGNPFQQYAARVTLGDAEYTDDGAINAADYVRWRDTLGANVERSSGADGNGSGVIDVGDYELWRGMFGMEVGMAASVQVPEPGGVTLVLLAALGLLNRRIYKSVGGFLIAGTASAAADSGL